MLEQLQQYPHLQVTKIVTVKTDTTTGSSHLATVSYSSRTVDPASTLSGVSTSVGIVTTSSTEPTTGELAV